MVKMTNQEWLAFKAKTGFKDPEGEALEQKKAMEVFMAELERIQYFPTDLSYALDIGEIADMHVDCENGVQILRMTVVPKKNEEYTTVRVAPPAKAKASAVRKQTAGRKQPGPSPGPATKPQRAIIDADKPFKPADKLIQMGKSFMAKKDKPQFMKDAGF
jgi:hypothetical protein